MYVLVLELVCQQLSFPHLLEMITFVTLATMELAGLMAISTEMILIWDGAGCGVTGTCCSFNTPPWFTKQLPSSTDDPIELRNSGDQGLGDENIGIKLLEVYVQLVCFWSFS